MIHETIAASDLVTVNQYPNRATYVVVKVQKQTRTGTLFVLLAHPGETYVRKIKLITDVTKIKAETS